MPKAQEIEAAMQPTKPGSGHKKERRFTVYKPTRVEREEEEQVEAEAGVNILSQNNILSALCAERTDRRTDGQSDT